MLSQGWLVGICLLFIADGASAQPGGSPSMPAGMDEDIEIMRRIMDRAVRDRWGSLFAGGLHAAEPNVSAQPMPSQPRYGYEVPGRSVTALPPLSGVPGGNWFTLLDSAGGSPRTTGLEGAYLKGYGVILTMTLPPVGNPGPRTGAEEAKAIKEWERVREQVRGQTPQPQPTEQPGKSASLADVLLKVLADNGHNFAKLAEDEKLTVIVTFRQPDVTTRAHAIVSGNAVRLWKYGEPNMLVQPVAKPELPAPARDNIVLGDLNLRQGRYQDAIKDYLKAAQAMGTTDSAKAVAPELARKLAQAYLGAGSIKEAKTWLEKADKFGTGVSAAAKDAPPATPTRLTITAGKALLDRAGSGKMSFDEFRRAATVDYRPTPPASAPKKVAPSP